MTSGWLCAPAGSPENVLPVRQRLLQAKGEREEEEVKDDPSASSTRTDFSSSPFLTSTQIVNVLFRGTCRVCPQRNGDAAAAAPRRPSVFLSGWRQSLY